MIRYQYILISIALLIAIACSKNRSTVLPISDHDLIFSELPARWDEAIPLGNGMLGALIWKKDDRVRFSLDRADLWDLRTVDNINRSEFKYQWVQEQVINSNYKIVQDLFDTPYDKMPAPTKLPGAGLEVEIGNFGNVISSRLDISKAICTVEWDSGTKMEVFIHAEDNAGWFRFTNVPGNFHLRIVPPDYNKDESGIEDNPVDGQELRRLDYSQGVVESKGTLQVYRQPCWDDFGYEVAVNWIKEEKTVTGVWGITTSESIKRDGESAESQVLKRLESLGFASSFSDHCDWWQKYWNKSSLMIPDSLLERQYFLEMYKFGSAARPDAPPISLQSVWTADNGKLPPWKGDYHHDLNTQLSYWPSYTGNHLDLELGYINWLWKNRETFKNYTKSYFGTAGLNVPGVSTLEGKPMGGWIQYAFGPTVSSWLAHHFYLHWRYSGDESFLRTRAYPWIKDVAIYLDEVSVFDQMGKRKLPISASPEINDNNIDAWFQMTTNFDLGLIRWTFEKAAEMAEELGENEEAKRWYEILNQWPDLSIDETGGLGIAPGYPYMKSHRHFSHLLAWHPLGIIDWGNNEDDREIIKATIASLEKYGPEGWTGYSYSWLANLYARALDGDKAAETLRIFARCFCLDNSFHVNGDQCLEGYSNFHYRPFTLEGNFAFASAVQEMLLQSHTGIIHLFPAIPSNWKDISFQKFRTNGAFIVSADKVNGEVEKVEIYSENSGVLQLKNPYKSTDFKTIGGKMLKQDSILYIQMKRGQTVIIEPNH